MSTENLITLLRNEIEKTGIKCYSPDFPQNQNMCARIFLSTGENLRSLSDDIVYSNVNFYVLIKGNTNDTETRRLADKVFNQLDMLKGISLKNIRVILVTCKTPNYAFRDENQNICYNINCNVKFEGRED